MVKVDLFNIEKAIAELAESLAKFATEFSGVAEDYSPQGQRKAWQSATVPHVARIAELHTLINAVEQYGRELVEGADADLFPVADPTDAAAVTAAELTAARWLRRGIDAEKVIALTGLEPSPWRTIVVEEAVAAGVVKEAEVKRVFAEVESRTEEGTGNRAEARAVSSAVAILREQLRKVENRLENWRADNRHQYHVALSSVLREGTVDLAAGLRAWTPPKLALFSSPSNAGAAV